jgi:hypothetical protein
MDIWWGLINARPIIVKIIMLHYGYNSEGKLVFFRIFDISMNEIDPI